MKTGTENYGSRRISYMNKEEVMPIEVMLCDGKTLGTYLS
jgi:hypothetical protein